MVDTCWAPVGCGRVEWHNLLPFTQLAHRIDHLLNGGQVVHWAGEADHARLFGGGHDLGGRLVHTGQDGGDGILRAGAAGPPAPRAHHLNKEYKGLTFCDLTRLETPT